MKHQLILTTLTLLGLTGLVQAADCCSSGDCGKVCRLDCTTQTIETTCYGYQCEDVCINRPSEKACRRCKDAGKRCLFCCLHWTKWCPTSADIYQRKKLVKYEVTHEVPSFKWVIEPVCDPCGGGCCTGDVGTGAPGLDETPEEAVRDSEETDVPPAPQPVKSARLVPPRLQAKNTAVKSRIRNPLDAPRTPAAHVKPATFQPAAKHASTPTTSSSERSSTLREKNWVGRLFE